MRTKAVRVLIVDDSAVVRKCLAGWLGDNPDIEVVGTASDPYDARDKILSLNPDVITLDIEMPRMDGITFLKLIMQHRPMPVVIVSSLTTAGSHKALEALHSGAVDVMAKPHSYSISHEGAAELVEKIKAAAVSQFRRNPEHQDTAFHSQPTAIDGSGRTYHPKEIILIGASTGGTEALRKVLTRLPADLPGNCIVQHIAAYFSTTFAKRLDEFCSLEVIEAQSGDLVKPGRVLIAPGGYHMLLKNNGASYIILLNEGPESPSPAARRGCPLRIRDELRKRPANPRHCHDGNGFGRRARAAQSEECRGRNHRPGREQLRGVRDAEGGYQTGRSQPGPAVGDSPGLHQPARRNARQLVATDRGGDAAIITA
jgi:two-component system chemotaxis response regulator CheB